MLNEGIPLSVFDDVYHVGPLLGQGGEGAVHAVVDSEGNNRFALKWYHPHTAYPHRWAMLKRLAERPAPNDRFLWPVGVIAADDGSQFGYVMPLRPDDYVGLARVLNGEVARTDRMVTHSAAELARGFYALHSAGLCYRDVNFGNVFIHRTSGDILICDNDNVGIDGESTTAVSGTPRFMAPEIVRGEAGPSAATDRFSLAVLLFYILMVGHPLEGIRTETVMADDDAHLRFHGLEPLFCFDPDDDTNRPHPEYHTHVPDLWFSLPGFVRDLFTRAFTVGLHDPAARVRDSEWFAAMTRLGEHITICEHCGEERYVDPLAVNAPCAWCDGLLGSVLVIHLIGTDSNVIATPGASVPRHHFTFDLRDPVNLGVVERRPDHPGVIGLRNTGTDPWTVTQPGKEPRSIEPGRVTRIVDGTLVDVGPHRLHVARHMVEH